MKNILLLLQIGLLMLSSNVFPSLWSLKQEKNDLVQKIRAVSSSNLNRSNIILALKIAQAKTDENANENDLLKAQIKQLKKIFTQRLSGVNPNISKLHSDLKKEYIFLTDPYAPRDNEVE